jgi:hypothetical protein
MTEAKVFVSEFGPIPGEFASMLKISNTPFGLLQLCRQNVSDASCGEAEGLDNPDFPRQKGHTLVLLQI